MDWQLLITILSLSGLLINALLQAYWTKQHKESQDKLIQSKDAEIELLKSNNQYLISLTPKYITDQYVSVKILYEDYVEKASKELEAGKQALETVEKENILLRNNVEILTTNLERFKDRNQYINEKFLISTTASAIDISNQLGRGTATAIQKLSNELVKPFEYHEMNKAYSPTEYKITIASLPFDNTDQDPNE